MQNADTESEKCIKKRNHKKYVTKYFAFYIYKFERRIFTLYSGYENPEDNGLYDIANLSSDDLKAILLEDLESTGTDRLSPDEIKLIVGILKRREERETCSEIVSKEI